MRRHVEEELRVFVANRYARLRRTAYLLCGDWHRADDLVQTALARVVVASRRRVVDNLDAYASTTLLRTFLDDNRRLWRRRELSLPVPREDMAPAQDPTVALTVLAALKSLPPRQRAVVVLRYWEDRSVEETADALGINAGTVKSHGAKALAALRQALADLRPELTTSYGGNR
jgi:RNA polymerase sigma-70 factor (sigma-E family)